MEFSRFVDFCRRSAHDVTARDALWSDLYNAYYKRLCTFANGKMYSKLRKSEAEDFAADALAHIVVSCHMVKSNIFSVLCSEVRNRIIDEARRDKRFASDVRVDDGLEQQDDDGRSDATASQEADLESDPAKILEHAEDEAILHRLEQGISQFRRELAAQKDNSRTALYMHELLELHHYGGVGIRELAEKLSRQLAERGEKPVSYGNLRNVNMALLARMRELLKECNVENNAADIPE